MAQMTGARILAETLDGYGVTHVFFVPTILSETLVELEKRTEISRIVTHGEKAAAYMADGYARACGRPGVCMAQAAGAANLAAGLRDAYMACAPVVAFTGGPQNSSRYRHAYQEVEDFPLFRALTKSSARVGSVERIPDLVRQAFRSATSGRPGPVHLEFAGHLGEVESDQTDLEVLIEDRFASVPAFRPEPDPDAVEEAARLLTKAERPVIVAGGGVRMSDARAELVQLAEKLGIPVATSLNAKDVIPANHPLAVGVVGLYSRKSANRCVLEADLVFYVGSKTGSQVTLNWKVPPFGTPVIQLDIECEELGRNYPNKVSLACDARKGLRKLLDAVRTRDARGRSEWNSRVQEFVREWRAEFRPAMESDAVPIRPERLCDELSHVLPDGALLVSDTGHAGMWTAGMVDLTKPGQEFIRCAGSLGWGFPATLGAKLACPERPVVLFTGDGGFWYHLSELETAVRWGINAVIIVNNNRSMNQEIGPYTQAYGGRLHGRHEELWRFENIDFARIAENMGAKGLRITSANSLTGAIDEAIEAARPTVIDVVTDIEAMAPSGFASAGEPVSDA